MASAPPPPASATADGLDDARTSGRGRLLSILERRDVALVPALGFILIALMSSLSTLLRPGTRDYDLPFIGLSLFGAVLGGLLALTIDRPGVRAWRGRIATYLWIGMSVQVLLAAVAVIDGGIDSPYYVGTLVLGSYLGLVLPRLQGRMTAVVMLVASGAVILAEPGVPFAVQVIVPVLGLAGWLAGRAGHLTHGLIARAALTLSRSDVLTTTLNRRGFFEQLHWELARAERGHGPLSLLIVDLDEFKPINDRYGHEAGDAVLRWVGAQLPEHLPADAGVGRLGGDEFAIVLPATGSSDAHHCADRLRTVLSARIGVSIGVATTPAGEEVDADALVRTADQRMYAEKHGASADGDAWEPGNREQSSKGLTGGPARDAERLEPALTYAALRARGGPPSDPARLAEVSWLFTASMAVVTLAGALVGAVTLMHGSDSFYDDFLTWALGPWVLTCAALTALLARFRTGPQRMRVRTVAFAAAIVLLGVGVGVVALAGPGTGVANPIIAALMLKVMWDAYAVPDRISQLAMAPIVGIWLLIAVLGPADSLWVLPFQLSLFVSARAIGLVAHRAFTEATAELLHLAGSDVLTGVRNRSGFEYDVGRLLADGLGEQPLTLLAFDLDDFKSVNDQLGHEAGDELLRAVAGVARAALPGSYSVARVGGDEFAIAIRNPAMQGPAGAAALTQALEPIVGASVGYAEFGPDGRDQEALYRAADERSYEVKRERRAARHAATAQVAKPGSPTGCDARG